MEEKKAWRSCDLKMTSICICRGCLRAIEKSYSFCPWCGRAVSEIVDSAEHTGGGQKKIFEKCLTDIEKIEKKLNNLEETLRNIGMGVEK